MEFSNCVSHAIDKSININTDYMHFAFALLRKDNWCKKLSYGYE